MTAMQIIICLAVMVLLLFISCILLYIAPKQRKKLTRNNFKLTVKEAQKELDEYLSEQAYEKKLAKLEALKDEEVNRKLKSEAIDVTLPGKDINVGNKIYKAILTKLNKKLARLLSILLPPDFWFIANKLSDISLS